MSLSVVLGGLLAFGISFVSADSVGDYSDDFTLVLKLQPTSNNVGKSAFNDMFWNSEHHILKRECSGCGSEHRVIYYKRITLLTSFDLFTYTYDWESDDNVLGTDFNLYSTLSEAISGDNPWQYCNYDDHNIGMFRDCGKTGKVNYEWTSASRGGDSASFYIYTPNKSYIGRKEKVNWATASSRCSGFGGQLATFGNDADYARLVSIRGSLGYNAWIGLHDINTEGGWQFVDGDTSYCSPSTATGTDCDDIKEWQSGEPNNGGNNQDCAQMYSNGNLDDVGCTASKYYICEFSSSQLAMAQSNNLYIGRKEFVTWNTASSRCSGFGGQLATFGTDADYAAIVSIRGSLGSNSFIGLHDISTEGGWQFVDGDTSYCSPSTSWGTDCDDIDEWQSGEPNNGGGGGQDCAQVYSNGNLDDVGCTASKYYICEFSSSKVITAGVPFVPTLPTPGYFVYGVYSVKDMVVMVLAVFCVINLMTLAVCLLRTKGSAKVYYAKVVADTDDEDQPLAV